MKRTLKLYLEMYLLIIFPVLLVATTVFAQGNEQYKWFYPKPQGSQVNGIQAINALTWYGVTNSGAFIKTNNSGADWTDLKGRFISIQYGGSVIGLNDLHFSNINTGWVCGNGGTLAKTTDAGDTWTDTPVPGATSNWREIFFLDDSTGFVIGRFPESIAKTTDAGGTWSLAASLPVYAESFFAFNETQFIYSSSGGKIYTSNNGGANWSSMQIGSSNGIHLKVNFVNDTLGMISSYASIYLTTDGGASWTSRSSGLPAVQWRDIDFFIKGDSIEAYITGDRDNIYKDVINSGAGASWEAVDFKESPSQYRSTMWSTDIVGDDSLITVGLRGIFNKRFTASDRKAFLNRVGDFGLSGVWVSGNGNTIIAPGERGYVLRSTDAGDNWDTTFVGNNHHLTGGISMVDDNTGWTCGSSGAVYKTSDGGLSWGFQANAGSFSLRGSSFINSNTGWVVGDNNTVQKTTNSGINWTAQISPGVAGNFIYDIHMVDADTGFLVGTVGKVHKTTNGGSNWIDIGIEPDKHISGIFMYNASTGWLCGSRGTLRKTTNGGITWDSLAVPYPTATLVKLYFTDEWNGMVIGNGGLAFRTRDGGATWEYNNMGFFKPLGIYMTSTNTGYICDANGNIMKYEELLTGNTYTGSEIPEDFILQQNYPNPFNPVTTIKFALPYASAVSLIVYDIAGREVASLYNNEMLNAGTFEQRFDGSSLSSGVYFYSLVVNDKPAGTKKMLLIK